MRKLIGLLVAMLFMTSIGAFAMATPYTEQNPDENINNFGFTVVNSYWITQNGLADYSNLWKVVDVKLTNKLYVPDILIDNKNSSIAVDTHPYNITVNTTANSSQIIPGLPGSISGTYHYGYVNIGPVFAKIYVIDRYKAGVYDTVAIDVNNDYTIDYVLQPGQSADITYPMTYNGTQINVHIKLLLVGIYDNGTVVKFRNEFYGLKAGDPDPIGSGYLEPIPQAQWVLTPAIQLGFTVDGNNILLAIPTGNGSYRQVQATDYAQLVQANGTYRILAELGGMNGNAGIPPEREFYIIAKAVPPTVTITRYVQGDEVKMIVNVINEAGAPLPPGFVRIQNIVPISYDVKILGYNGAEPKVVYGAQGKDMLLIFSNGLPAGQSTVEVTYTIVDKTLQAIENVSKQVSGLSTQIKNSTNEIMNYLNSTVSKEVMQAVYNTQQIMGELNNQSKSIAQMSAKLDAMNQTLNQLANTLSVLVTTLTSQNTPQFDTNTMMKIYSKKYSEVMNLVANLKNNLQNSTNTDITQALNNIQAEPQSSLNPNALPDDPFVILMDYIELEHIQDRLNGMMIQMAIDSLQKNMVNPSDINQLLTRINGMYSILVNMQAKMSTTATTGTAGKTTTGATSKTNPLSSTKNNSLMLIGILIILVGAGSLVILKKRSSEEEEEEFEEEEFEEEGGFMAGGGGEAGGFGGFGGGFGGAPGNQFGGQAGNFGAQQGNFANQTNAQAPGLPINQQ